MYNVNLEQITFRFSPGNVILDENNLKVMGRNRVLNGSILLLKDIDDTFIINVKFYTDTTGTGNWRLQPFNIRDYPPCVALVDFHQFLEPTLMQGVNTNFPIKGDVCPIPKGNYYFTDISINCEHWPAQVPRGPVKGVLTLTKNGTYIGELELYFTIENNIF